MQLIIHRGTKEIGGSCVEIRSADGRILVDLGMPLVDEKEGEFNKNRLKGKNISQLIADGILPDIKGLYKGSASEFDAILISHPHQDHYGLLNYINTDIPLYMSKGCRIMIQASHLFGQTDCELSNIKEIGSWDNPFQIKGFKIIPYLTDHSGFDSRAFLIEAEGKKIFYTGDFRGHGRKSIVFKHMLEHAPKNVDFLLMEGTGIGREDGDCSSENDIENELVKLFRQESGLNILSCSSQNIDRIVSVFRACMRSGKTFVIDPYTAYILDKCHEVGKGLPMPGIGGTIKVFCTPNKHTKILDDLGITKKYSNVMVPKEYIVSKYKKLVLKDNWVNRSFVSKLKWKEKPRYIYSQWSGYLKKDKQLKMTLKRVDVELIIIHTSGHAIIADLKKLADAIDPKSIIPIHTFSADEYSSIFKQPVRQVADGETIEL
ncbi:MAG: MBL fold metallo-hydrolase [Candidatus Margulisiibacteriota bacterium]